MDLEALASDATARIAAAPDSAALEAVRIEVLGRKAPLVLALRALGSLPPDERRVRGAELNRARVALEQQLARRVAELGEAELEQRLRTDRVDVTLPGLRRHDASADLGGSHHRRGRRFADFISTRRPPPR